MKLILTTIFLLLISVGQAQVIDTKDLKPLELSFEQPKQSNWNYYVGYSLIAVGAFGEAYNHIQEHRPTQFFIKHPNASKQFWGDKQWYNKWELDNEGLPIVGQEKFIGSSTIFVTFLDAEHSTSFVRNFGYITGATIIQIGSRSDKEWWVYAVEIGGIVILRAIILESVDHYYRGY